MPAGDRRTPRRFSADDQRHVQHPVADRRVRVVQQRLLGDARSHEHRLRARSADAPGDDAARVAVVPGTVRDGDALDRPEDTGGAGVVARRPRGGEHQVERFETAPRLVEMLRGHPDADNHGPARVERLPACRRHRASPASGRQGIPGCLPRGRGKHNVVS